MNWTLNEKKKIVDVRSVSCDGLWLAIPALRESAAGEQVEVWLDKPKDKLDIAKWSSKIRMEVEYFPSKDGQFEKLTIRKLKS